MSYVRTTESRGYKAIRMHDMGLGATVVGTGGTKGTAVNRRTVAVPVQIATPKGTVTLTPPAPSGGRVHDYSATPLTRAQSEAYIATQRQSDAAARATLASRGLPTDRAAIDALRAQRIANARAAGYTGVVQFTPASQHNVAATPAPAASSQGTPYTPPRAADVTIAPPVAQETTPAPTPGTPTPSGGGGGGDTSGGGGGGGPLTATDTTGTQYDPNQIEQPISPPPGVGPVPSSGPPWLLIGGAVAAAGILYLLFGRK